MPSFSLIVDKTDTYGFLSRHARYRYKQNYYSSKSGNFVDNVSGKVNKYRVFRIHLVGHFYCQEYVDKWIEISHECVHTRFITYLRKEKELDLDFKERKDNMMVLGLDREGPDGIVYSDRVENCPQIHCGVCLKCFSGAPLGVGSYPFP
jgi:hypothetical protein